MISGSLIPSSESLLSPEKGQSRIPVRAEIGCVVFEVTLTHRAVGFLKQEAGERSEQRSLLGLNDK